MENEALTGYSVTHARTHIPQIRLMHISLHKRSLTSKAARFPFVSKLLKRKMPNKLAPPSPSRPSSLSPSMQPRFPIEDKALGLLVAT